MARLTVWLAQRMRLSRARFEVLLLDWLDLELSIATINHCLHEAGLLLWLWVICSAEVLLCLIGHRTAEKLEHGFLRVRCDTCHAEHRVAFSCCPQWETIKSRGLRVRYLSCPPKDSLRIVSDRKARR